MARHCSVPLISKVRFLRLIRLLFIMFSMTAITMRFLSSSHCGHCAMFRRIFSFSTDTNNDYEIWSIDHGFWFDSLPFPWQLSPVEQIAGRIQVPRLTARIPAESWNKAIAAISKLDSSLMSRKENDPYLHIYLYCSLSVRF